MIFDCFPILNEFDLLELRLEELSPVVDQFIIVESPLTHSGRDKPLYFQENKQRFARWLPKIRHLVVDPIVGQGRNWERDHQQRDWLMKGIPDASDDDLVISTDLDEIVAAESLKRSAYYCLNSIGKKRAVHIQQRTYYYYFNLRWRLDWFCAVIGTAKCFRERSPTDWRYGSILRDEIVQDGGWHFTYMGGLVSVIHKMESFAHDGEQTNVAVIDILRSGMSPDVQGADRVYPVSIDQSFPKAVYEQQKKWIDRGFIKV